MQIIPSIVILDGQCVEPPRAGRGECAPLEREPAEVAREYAMQGASALHVVDQRGETAGRLARDYEEVERGRASARRGVGFAATRNGRGPLGVP